MVGIESANERLGRRWDPDWCRGKGAATHSKWVMSLFRGGSRLHDASAMQSNAEDTKRAGLSASKCLIGKEQTPET